MIRHSIEDHTNALAQYLPNGKMFEAKNIHDSNFRALLRGLAGELFTAEGYLVDLDEQYFPDTTEQFLAEWESALGIPDACFSGIGTYNERRRDVIVKLSSLGIQTALDFEALGDVFGIPVTVKPGTDHAVFPMTFPIYFTSDVLASKYVIIVTFEVDESSKFPLTFPFTFGDESIGILECLFGKLKPSNCDIVFSQV